jgi:hypothetical protein
MSDEPSGWAAGWAFFAAVMLVIAGTFQIISGIVAIAKDEFFVVNKDWVFSGDLTTWGWIHLILGIVVVLVGFGILSGNVFARVIGVLIAGVSAIANFAFLPFYPVWSIVLIAVDITIIWALTAHGRDIQKLESGQL